MKIKPKQIFFQIFMVIVSILTLFPIFFVYNNALKPNMEISNSFLSITKHFYLAGFKYILIDKKAYTFLINSFIVVIGAILICLIVSILVSFRLARFNIKFGNGIYLLFLAGIILSHQTSIVPIYIILSSIKLINTYFGLMLVFSAWNLSLSILIITAFFRSIPKELQDAATIDGCSNTGFLMRIMLPLSKAPISTAALLSVIFVWNDLILPLTLINNPKMKLVSSSLIYFKGEYFADYNLLFSAIAFMILPIIILYLVFQRYFISGTFAGAIIE
ncbi:MAG: carbohydrate ABC transporter permease [Actinobacteria bacterium]|nr:carbohydrate ABC transporter permease [Actinomycetota bacterium]